MATALVPRPVPRASLGFAIVVAVGAIGSAFLFPERESGLGVLLWITAVIPSFLLAYFRGHARVAVLLAASMVALTIIQASAVAGESPDALPPARPALYAMVLVGLLVLIELLDRERRRVEQAGLINPVTGLPNRQYLDLAIQQEFAAAERGRGITVVMFDVDGLSGINSRFGRPAGDFAVNSLAKLVATNTRKENLSAHFDGGRFVSALREATAPEAAAFAQRIIDQFRETPFPWGRATASAGIAEYETGMGSHELLIAAADRAVSRAKAGGRDVLAFAPDKAEREGIARRAADALRGHEPITPPARRRIFLVDDDASVRSAIKGMLVQAGFDVWDSADPERVVARYLEVPAAERPAAIIADVLMPGMTGPRMIARIAETDPAVRVVYISGYAQGELAWNGAPGGKVALLAKPFKSEEMLAALHDVLGVN
jgi:diguanylate cyclase (GGDEF)-like protein